MIKLLLSLEIKRRKQRPIHLFRDGIEGGEAEVLDADGGVRRAQAAELAAGTDDGQGVLRVTRQEEVKRREIVQHAPQTHHAGQLTVGQVLVDHQQVVAEVEERLVGALRVECAAADVEDDRLRRAAQPIAPRAESPTEVDLLLVGEEACV